MYHKIKINDRALMPVIVIYPLALYAITFGCYFIFTLTHNPLWFKMAFVSNAAGVLMALIGALPAFLDWALGITDTGEIKSVGLKHMLCNIIALLFFVVNLYSNSGQWNTLQPAISNAVFLAGAGLLCTLIAILISSKLEHQPRIRIYPLTTEEIEDATHIGEQAIPS